MLRSALKEQVRISDCDWSAASLRALAVSAGIQFESVQAEVDRLHDKIGPDQKEAYDESIGRLARGGAISAAEQHALLELGRRGFAVGSDAEFDKLRRYAGTLHQRMSRDSTASPVALAIVGVISNYAVLSPRRSVRRGRIVARKASQHPVRDILLGAAGGAVGGLMMSGWNPFGGVVGGVVGGIVAGIKALC
jgi:hypothetical protein